MKVYTRTGDDGTTGLLYGGRVAKNSALPEAYGSVDEAQAFIGVVRAEVADDQSELGELLLRLGGELWVLMAELATLPENRHKLTDGATRVTAAMVEDLEHLIDAYSQRFEPPTDFVVPGANKVAAGLDVARTVVRRAERASVDAVDPDSSCGQYLNRLSDLLWTLARWAEGDSGVLARESNQEPPSGSEPERT